MEQDGTSLAPPTRMRRSKKKETQYLLQQSRPENTHAETQTRTHTHTAAIHRPRREQFRVGTDLLSGGSVPLSPDERRVALPG